MKLTSARRLGAFVALGVVAALAPAVTQQASAETGSITQDCTIDGKGASLVHNQNTTAPATSPAGTSIKPTYFLVLTLPKEFVDALKSQSGGIVQGIGGTVKANLTTNGSATPITVTLPNTKVPAAAGTAMKFTASAPMAQVTPGGPGTITYAAGDLNLTLKFLNGSNGTLATRTGKCDKPASNPVVDKVTITGDAPPPAVLAPSRIGTGVAYVKKTKKLTVAGKVIANPNQVVTGNMNLSLFKAGKRVRNVTKPLSQSAAKTTYTGKIGKGKYVLKITFYGSPKVKSSTVSRTIVIK